MWTAWPYLCKLYYWLICVYYVFGFTQRSQPRTSDKVCWTFKGKKIRKFRISWLFLKFTLQEVERIEKNGNLVVESSWMGSYDDRSGKKVSKDSPLFKKFLEDKYERKCWFIPYTKPKIRLGSLFSFWKKMEIRGDQFYTRTRKSKNKKVPAENISSPAPALISIPRKPPSRTNSMRLQETNVYAKTITSQIICRFYGEKFKPSCSAFRIFPKWLMDPRLVFLSA